MYLLPAKWGSFREQIYLLSAEFEVLTSEKKGLSNGETQVYTNMEQWQSPNLIQMKQTLY